tara:strand:+ start:648 stop:776 length:129 start_codon:yes stop_codon:yes gene_type:complete
MEEKDFEQLIAAILIFKSKSDSPAQLKKMIALAKELSREMEK